MRQILPFATVLLSSFFGIDSSEARPPTPTGIVFLADISNSFRAGELAIIVEGYKRAEDKIKRPVFFRESAQPDLQYEVDAWHPEWRAGLEAEAGRAWMGNAIYRDLIQALVMVDMDHLVLAAPQAYRYRTGGRTTVSKDYDNTVSVAQALYGHSRISMPFSQCVIGY